MGERFGAYKESHISSYYHFPYPLRLYLQLFQIMISTEMSTKPEGGAPWQSASVGDVERIENVESYDNQNRAETLIAEAPKRKWQSYIWDSLDKSPEERKLILKIDCSLLIIACLGRFSVPGLI